MVSIDEAVICRLKRQGFIFEILVDPIKAAEFRKTRAGSLEEILAINSIYRDARKGDNVSTEEMQKSFGTTNIQTVLEKILLEGEIQLTTDQRRKMVEDKRTQIADIIAKRAINPQTNLPHPPNRIINAMEQVGVHVDPFADAEAQIDSILKAIKVLLPIKLQRVVFQVTIPPQFTGKVYSLLKKSVGEFEERWLNDGSLQAIINVPAGIQMDLLKNVGDMTHGDFKSEILRKEDV